MAIGHLLRAFRRTPNLYAHIVCSAPDHPFPAPARDRAFIALIRTDTVVKELLNKGKRVIAIMHSYGGQVGTSALTGTGLNERSKAGFPGGVSHLVYMTAFAMPEGGAMMDKVKEFSHMDLIPLAFDIAEDGTCVNRDPKTLMIGPGIDDDEADACVLAMGRWNGGAMYERITNCAWREISVSYIYTTQDMTVPYDYQKSFVEGMRAQGREVNTFELETGHAPHLTKTEEVVDIINQVAGI